MKKSQIIRALALGALLLASCIFPGGGFEASRINLPAIAPVSTDTAAAPGVANSAAALVAANTQFALDLFHQFNPQAGANVFFSPYSISTALAMTWAGARGDTALQMAKVLRLSDLAESDVTPAFGALQKNLGAVQARGDVQLAVANSLWTEQNPEAGEHPFLPSYLGLVQKDFLASTFLEDFKNNSGAASGRINAWVAQKTNNKITDILGSQDLNGDTRMVLVDAIYFKGQWANRFPQGQTENAPFHLAVGGDKTVPMMHERFDAAQVGYTQVNDRVSGAFQILQLPYRGNDVSFVVLLPAAMDGLGALEKNLTAEKLAGWLGRLNHGYEVDAYLPKFKLTERYPLGATLQSMGMTDAFIDPIFPLNLNNPHRADFSGLNGARDLLLQNVIHQAWVDVDEEGTEAAAATESSIGIGCASTPPPELVTFRADHPFLFLIYDNSSGSILFMGRLASPE